MVAVCITAVAADWKSLTGDGLLLNYGQMLQRSCYFGSAEEMCLCNLDKRKKRH